MTCLVSKIDYFQVLSMVQSIFIRLAKGEEGYRNCRVACDVMAAMLVDMNNKVFLLLKLTSIFMQTM